jgi:glycosyltransferase involved in cell wall biosynthesis
MIRFAKLLNSGFINQGVSSEIWWPTVFFGSKAKITNAGVGKWLGYLDKYVVFPVVMVLRLRSSGRFRDPNVRYHICDHSNSPYLKYLPAGRSSITCHDVIAIRGGLGYSDSFQPASKFGKILQKWIANNLKSASSIAFVSQLTLKQFKEVVIDYIPGQKNWRVIHNSFNAVFNRIDKVYAEQIITQRGVDVKTPFILHVGSSLPRKNRKMLLDMVVALDSSLNVNICFAGEGLNSELRDYADLMGIKNKITEVIKPDHSTLVALYNSCLAFVFPSLSEGFGWPLIEAQACGAPVIASNIEPMPEVSGGAAIHVNANDPKAFAEALGSLQNEVFRQSLIEKGFENCLRFNEKQMIESYLNFIAKTNNQTF